MIGCSLYCQVGPPTVVSSSTTSEGENGSNNDNSREEGTRRQKFNMTPEERKEYISRVLVVKVCSQDYHFYITPEKIFPCSDC